MCSFVGLKVEGHFWLKNMKTGDLLKLYVCQSVDVFFCDVHLVFVCVCMCLFRVLSLDDVFVIYVRFVALCCEQSGNCQYCWAALPCR